MKLPDIELVKEARKLYAQGLPYNVIARRLGQNRIVENWCKPGYLERLEVRIVRQQEQDALDAKIKKMVGENPPWGRQSAVARELGVPERRVHAGLDRERERAKQRARRKKHPEYNDREQARRWERRNGKKQPKTIYCKCKRPKLDRQNFCHNLGCGHVRDVDGTLALREGLSGNQ